MATSYYSTGTVTLTNGSAVVTGNGTGWMLALIKGGEVTVEALGNTLPIASVESDTQLTAELEWAGETGTYNYTIQRDSAYRMALDQNSENLSYLLSELRAGTIFKYDQSGDLPGRDLYDARPKNFGYLVTIGVSQPVFYVKASNTDGDWAGPFPYGTGPVGPAAVLGIGTVSTLAPGSPATASVTGADGDYDLNLGIPAGLTGITFLGEYNPATAYVLRDAVRFNGSTYAALQATMGNAPPNLPATSNAYWKLVAAKGLDGTGVGDMVKSTYDPQNLQVDAFARGNHTGDIPDSVAFADGTKKARLDAGAVTAGQVRVLSMPDKDIDLADYFRANCVVGSAYTEFTTYFGGADAVPSDDSIPQINEGSGIMGLSYTPKSASNNLLIIAIVQASADALRNLIASIFVGNGSDAARTGYAVTGGGGYHVTIAVMHRVVAGTTSPLSISVRAGPGGAGVCCFNGLPSNRLFGGKSACTLLVLEMKP